jgi:hypothetical protein
MIPEVSVRCLVSQFSGVKSLVPYVKDKKLKRPPPFLDF